MAFLKRFHGIDIISKVILLKASDFSTDVFSLTTFKAPALELLRKKAQSSDCDTLPWRCKFILETMSLILSSSF